MSWYQDDEDLITPEQREARYHDQDRVLSNGNNDKHRVPWNKADYEGQIPANENNDESRTLSNKNKRPKNKKVTDRKRLSVEPNAEVFTFHDTVEIMLFSKRNYMVAIKIILNPSRMRAVNFVFHTGTVHSLLREDMVEPDWMSTVRISENLKLESWTSQ